MRVRPSRAALMCAFATVLAVAARAQTPARPAPPPDGPPLVSTVLPNGLEIIVLEDHSIPLVTIDLAVRTGSFTEPPELNGLSHLYEHMFFRSNRATAAGEPYTQMLGRAGLQYNARTREEVVDYYMTTTTPNLGLAMRYMRDALRFPVFDEQEFAREKAVVIAEIDERASNSYQDLQTEVTRRVFFAHPSRKLPTGSRETVATATTAAMKLIQSRYYVPNNTAVIVMGDASPQAVFDMAAGLFGDWARSPDPFVAFPLVEHPPLEASAGVIIRRPVHNVTIAITWQGPSIGKDDASTYAADVFSFILRQPDSRFQRAMVDSGLVDAIDFSYYTQRNVGPISLMLRTSPEKAAQALRAVYAEIARFNDPAYYTNAELDNAKALLEANDLYEREKLSEYTQTTAFWWSTAGVDYFKTYLKRLRATSRADVTRYVTTYIQNRPHVAAALLSPESLKTSGLTEAQLIGPAAAEGRVP